MWANQLLVVASALGAGFAAALLFGVPAGFSQPLATFLAGAGALSAGILAYLNGERTRELTKHQHEADTKRERERHWEDSRHAKESALRDRYTATAAQIADDSSAIRQAGVYALTALADDWHAHGEDDERQVCINLLQWYLRVPFPRVGEDELPDLAEREIRQTIVSILAERRRRSAENPKSWAANVISLHQVSLPSCALPLRNLDKLNLYGADLAGADLTGTNLHEANLQDANLSGATLATADLTRANLIGANLTNTNLTEVDLPGANLTGADLTAADLAHANLSEANLNGANLNDADLTGANLNGADLTAADLTNANLSEANLNGADLSDVYLNNAKLSRADLSGAVLSTADLANAGLSSAKLIGAKLSDVNLEGANLTDADLTGAYFFEVVYDANTKWPGGAPPQRPTT